MQMGQHGKLELAKRNKMAGASPASSAVSSPAEDTLYGVFG